MDINISESSNQNPQDPRLLELLQQFSCLNTNDRDVIMKQFKCLLGEQEYPDAMVEFWLDMNNWNLQAALCSFFDYGQTPLNNLQLMLKPPSVEIVLPLEEGQQQKNYELMPNSSFTYMCTMRNSGNEQWPYGCTLKFYQGTQMGQNERYLLPTLKPDETFVLQMKCTSPNENGVHFSQWRFSTITGHYFGESIYIIVNVIDDLSEITTQLSNAHINNNNNNNVQQVIQNNNNNNNDLYNWIAPPPQSNNVCPFHNNSQSLTTITTNNNENVIQQPRQHQQNSNTADNEDDSSMAL